MWRNHSVRRHFRIQTLKIRLSLPRLYGPQHLFTVRVSQSDFLSNFSIFTLDWAAEWCIGPNLVRSQSEAKSPFALFMSETPSAGLRSLRE